MDLLLLLGSLAIILVAAALFTNGIAWFGRRLTLAAGSVGSVLASLQPALPEPLIPAPAHARPLTSAPAGTGAAGAGVT